MIFPGFDGGGEWGGAAVNPSTGMLFVNASEMPWILTLFETGNEAGGPDALGKRIYSENCVYCHGVDLKGDPLGEFPPLQDLGKKYSIEQLADIVRMGKERMPGFDYLTAPEVAAVVEYMRDLESRVADGRDDPDASTEALPQSASQFRSTGYHRFVDSEGFPAVKPPWGTLTAIDLNHGEITWQVPLGETLEMGDGGAETGIENYGGPILTAGGLLFIAASKDAHLRAFDAGTGKELWKAKLPAAGYATPCTYSIAGRQYVVIAAGGGKIGTREGDAYVAFALPK